MMKTYTQVVVCSIGAMALAGCSSTGSGTSTAVTTGSDARDARIAEQQREIQTLEEAVRARDASLAAAQSDRAPTSYSSTSGELLPPNAKPGECFARVLVPAKYETENVRVLSRQAAETINVIPAKYKTVQKKVLVQEAATRLELVPAEYEWVEERVEIQPASSRVETVPAVYGWDEEKILIKPAHTVWKKGRGPIERVDNATGEIVCLVEVPAAYKTVKKRVVLEPARTKTIEIPAKYGTVKKRVVKTPPRTREVEIPAEYKTITVTELVEPARETKTQIPEEYETITKRVKTSEEAIEWRMVLCETNMTPALIAELQRALGKAGYNAGAADGVLGNQTMDAVTRFQRANNLPTGGITLKTMEKLGIKVQ